MIQKLLNPDHYFYAFAAWPPFIVGTSILVLVTVVLFRQRFSQISRAFAWAGLSVAVWLLGEGAVYSSAHPSVALQWARLEHIGVAFIPSTLFAFTLILVKRHLRYRFLARSVFVVSVLFAYASLSGDLWIDGLKKFAWGFTPQYGPMGWSFLGFILTLFASSLFLIRKAYSRFQSGVQQMQLRAFFQSYGIASLGIIDVLACYGYDVYPIGYLPIYAAMLLLAQTIWRYRFADITPAFAANEITQTMPNALLVFDHRGILCLANPSACDLFGRTEAELVGTLVDDLVAVHQYRDPFVTLQRNGVIKNIEIGIDNALLGKRSIILSASIIRDSESQPMAYVCVAEDVTDRKNTERALWASESRFQRLFDANIIGFMRVDYEGHILDANEALLKLLGYTRDDFQRGKLGGPSMTPTEYHPVDEWMRERLRTQGVCQAIDKEYVRRDGSRIPVLVGAVQLRDFANECLCFVIDATERRAAIDALKKAHNELELRVQERTIELQNEILRRQEAEEALQNQAITDPLTGLLNRRGFMAMADQQLKLALREDRRLRLYFADLDGLKPINDQFGHQEGDHAITQAAAILKSVFRASDVVARIGGDEYAVVALENDEVDDSRAQETLQFKISEYNRISGRPYRLGMTIGSSCTWPGRTCTLAQLIAEADKDLYARKEQRAGSPIRPNSP